MSDRVRHDEMVERLRDLPDWEENGFALHARYDAPDVPTAVALLADVMEAAEEQDHHPDVDLRWKRLRFRLQSHDIGTHGERDLRLAATISELARTHGASSMGGVPARVEVGIDTADADRIRPFWVAALDYEAGDEGLWLEDPEGNGPFVWFQVTDGAAEGRNRLHLDVSVPEAEIEDRRAAVEEAGGVEGATSNPPSWWVYADPDGNEVCLCTSAGRE